uniref:Uncharacterized protein n=1 Tax=Xiphophorus couchianus TaxID=32473 RepID=A0A3B5M2M1_9TELE
RGATNLGYTPPDGGWGWTVVFATFISIGFSYAFPKSLTIYFKEIQEYVSVSYSQQHYMLANRPVVMVDGLMVCVGMVIGSLGTSIIHLCVGVIGIEYYFSFLFLSNTFLGLNVTFCITNPLANGLAMVEGPVVLSTLAPLN